MLDPLLCIIPTLLTFGLILRHGNLILGLVVGVLSSVLIISKFSPFLAVSLLFERLATVLELNSLTSFGSIFANDKILFLLFIVAIGIFISLVFIANENEAWTELLQRLIKTPLQAQLTTLFLAIALFIDEDLSEITIFSLMRRLAEKFHISKMRLAILISTITDTTTTIIPVSGWMAYIISSLREAGFNHSLVAAVNASGSFTTITHTIPFVFYAIFATASLILLAFSKNAYGELFYVEQTSHFIKMHPRKYTARSSPQKVPPEKSVHLSFSSLVSLSTILLLPIAIFITMLYTGGFFSTTTGLIQSLQNANVYFSILTATVVGIIYITTLKIFHGSFSAKNHAVAIFKGISMAKNILVVSTLAWTLSSFIKHDLYPEALIKFLLALCTNYKFLPLTMFITSTVVAFLVCSAIVSMPIMFNIVMPIIPTLLEDPQRSVIIFPMLGAIISGTLLGSRVAPGLDNFLLAFKDSQININSYVKAKIQCLAPAAIGCMISFGLSGILSNRLGYWQLWLASTLPGLFITITLFTAFCWAQRQVATSQTRRNAVYNA